MQNSVQPERGEWPLLSAQPQTPDVRDPDPAGRPTPRPGSLRASDTDRSKVAAVLSTAYAEGRLTHEEHEERLDAAMRARTFDELIPLTDDLIPLDRPLPSTSTPAGPTVDRTSPSAAPDRMMAMFSGFERKGVWRVHRQNQLLVMFGGGEIDLTEAVLEGDEIEINGLVMFGGLEITVPEGMAVRNETMAVFGGSEVKVPAAPPGAPTLVLRGLVMFGGIEVKLPKAVRKKLKKGGHTGHGCGRIGR
ncbi:DUF1707 SHOCT-like domain-containing protein [Desertihabitans aurantiacus]|uniref:DUF1707 SHOCT-like domain-containing protein n=1 Tax=Desertihabitans aurantiacus TaxID=2282477 RepID=UPI0018E4EB0D|nr:DUF1707 domain-containing protein [Desertihabitans aurantiacus]